jgi:hypothetical protein
MAEGSPKLILVHRDPLPDLDRHLAGLTAIATRTLSVPASPAPEPPIAAFVELWGPVESLRAAFASWPAPVSAWLVEETRPADAPRSGPSGSVSPGIRLVSSVYKRPGLDRAEFARYWRGPHAEIALAYTVPVWRYSQNVVVEAWGPEEGEDGFAVLHFRSEEDLAARWSRHPVEARRGAEDAARFMDATRGWNAAMRETVWEQEAPVRG